MQLWNGYEERERNEWIKLGHVQVTIARSMTGERVELRDFLPWYDDYIREKQGLPRYEQPDIDFSVPQLERVTLRVLDGWGLDADLIERGSEDWNRAEKTARDVIGIPEEAKIGADDPDSIIYQGITVKKADPAIWGETPPWVQEEFNRERMEQLRKQRGN